ncbi:MAG: ATP-binding protein [Porphyromonadaceae bacterium]|nr:MAG: ATP-binding protein [Porphyromonadaceae bacterium]
MQPVNFDELANRTPGESSEAIRRRVVQARAIQSLRFKASPGIHCNAQMTTSMVHQYAEPDAEGLELLRNAIERMNMSARAYDRILKVARTIADLEGSISVRSQRHHGSHRLPHPRPLQLFRIGERLEVRS